MSTLLGLSDTDPELYPHVSSLHVVICRSLSLFAVELLILLSLIVCLYGNLQRTAPSKQQSKDGIPLVLYILS